MESQNQNNENLKVIDLKTEDKLNEIDNQPEVRVEVKSVWSLSPLYKLEEILICPK